MDIFCQWQIKLGLTHIWIAINNWSWIFCNSQLFLQLQNKIPENKKVMFSLRSLHLEVNGYNEEHIESKVYVGHFTLLDKNVSLLNMQSGLKFH